MKRRDFLVSIGGVCALAALPRPALAAPGWDGARTLLLVELAGGNDGLNTVVPYANPAYYALRPGIAIRRDDALQLDERLGLHPQLKPLMDSWQAKELAIVQGVGYARPNRSHFRSIDIWETASGAERVLSEGWIARLFADRPRPSGLVADGLVFGGGNGAVQGPKLRAVNVPDPQRFVRQAQGMRPHAAAAHNAALAHILKVEREIGATAEGLRALLAKAPQIDAPFPAGGFGDQLRVAARLLAAGARLPVMKVSLGGFDTHAGQPQRHAQLMRQLGEGLAAFRAAAKATGQWPRVLAMTYSEFGRRAGQNGSNGTDHGTAAPHFVLGATVKGGLHGPAPDFANLEGGDLKHAFDYRQLYATVAESWWHLGATPALAGHKALPVL